MATGAADSQRWANLRPALRKRTDIIITLLSMEKHIGIGT